MKRKRVKNALVLAALLCLGRIAAAQPPQIAIPRELSPPQEAYAAYPEPTPDTPAAASAPAAPSACQLRLSKLATFKPLPMLVGAGECGATDAVLLDGVILPDQSKVAVTPAATLRCPMAEQIALWVRDDVEPLTVKLGGPVRALDNFDSYECRGRNRIPGARLSEHGRANALDVRLFKLADGQSLALTDANVDKAWREAIKAGVCARFSTILGPGSDGAHEEHIHLDLAERRGNYKVCEWDVRSPAPVAQAQPKAAAEVADKQPAEDAADSDDDASAPLDVVPLPRPRPRVANAGSSKNSSRN